MSHAYRRERYMSGKSSTTEGWLRVVVTIIVILICIGVIFFQWQNSSKLQDAMLNQEILVGKFEQELAILRTLNPYHVESNEIIATAVENVDLFPGWVARVYPIPEGSNNIRLMNDLGSFVMNETRFSLSSHKSYGIPQPSKSMYRLNGLFPSYKKGRLQVGVEFYVADKDNENSANDTNKVCSCYARIEINNKRVIDKRIRMYTRYEEEAVLTGEVELSKGVFPISAMLYCDEKSDFSGEDVQVSISFRNPGQHSLSASRYSIFHIYKPETFTAKL